MATTYSYVGTAFNSFIGIDACPSQCYVSGEFTVITPLLPSQEQRVFEDSFSFTDGLITLTNLDVPVDTDFEFVTDAAGEINFSQGWCVSLAGDIRDDGPGTVIQPHKYIDTINQQVRTFGCASTNDQTYQFEFDSGDNNLALAGDAGVFCWRTDVVHCRVLGIRRCDCRISGPAPSCGASMGIPVRLRPWRFCLTGIAYCQGLGIIPCGCGIFKQGPNCAGFRDTVTGLALSLFLRTAGARCLLQPITRCGSGTLRPALTWPAS